MCTGCNDHPGMICTDTTQDAKANAIAVGKAELQREEKLGILNHDEEQNLEQQLVGGVESGEHTPEEAIEVAKVRGELLDLIQNFSDDGE